MKATKLKSKLIFLEIGSFIVSVAPLLTTLIFNWERYTKAPEDSVKLCIGGGAVVLFIFLKAIGKLKMPRRVVLFGIVFIMSYLLEMIMKDMILLSGMALFGELMDYSFFQRNIRKTKENIHIGKTADVTTQQVEEVIKKYLGDGRV